MKLTLKGLEESKEIIKRIDSKDRIIGTDWSGYQILVHCSKTIEYAMTGYPRMKPALIRGTIGKIAIHKFLRQGYMKHNLEADVPNSPNIEYCGTLEEGKIILLNSMDKFINYHNNLKPHLLFGTINKRQYDQYFAMHIADHLSVFTK